MNDMQVIHGDAGNGFETIRLVFTGQDESGGWAWRLEGQTRVRVWTGRAMRGRIPGGIYSIEAKTEDGAMIVRPSTLRYIGEMSEDAAILQAREAKAEQERRVKSLERNTSKTAAIDEAIAPLLQMAAPLNWYDRNALGELVRNRILKGK